jgi:pimeloyl-ACP methyl ester carboxylesterase
MQLHFRDTGSGTPVLLIHSGGMSSRQWRKLEAAVAEKHRAIVPDLLGYGATGTWPANEPFHFSQDVAALEELLASLGEPAHLVGHSYGGFLALKLAVARPESVRSLALYEPVAFGVLTPEERKLLPSPLEFEGTGESWLESFVDHWNGRGAWAALNADTKQAFRSVAWKLSREVVTLAADATTAEAYRALKMPTLLLGGSLTPQFEQRVLARLHEALAGSRLQVFEGVGHMGPITHAALVNAAIVEQLAGARG